MSRVAFTLLTTAALLVGLLVTPVLPQPAEPVVPTTIDVVAVPPADPTGPRSGGWATAAPLEAPRPFAMVGVELPPAAGEDVAVEIRTADGDGPWSAWTDLPHLHGEGPDPGSAEAAGAADAHLTHPVFVGEATRLQVRVDRGDPADLRAHLIDPFGLDRSWLERTVDRVSAAWDGTPAGTASATVEQPAIVSRAGWGADESIRDGEPAYARDVDGVFVHHTVGSNSYTPAQAPGLVRGVYAYHVQSNGWSDIGYNFIVDRFGTIYEGRFGGIDRAVIGAQAGGFNTATTGIALLGTFTSADPPQAAMDALARLIAWKADVHHIDPLGGWVATSRGSDKYPEGVEVPLQVISGHRDVKFTECPGGAVYARLPGLRQTVRALAGDLVVDHASSLLATRVIRGNPDADEVVLSARLDPPGDWAITVHDPAGAVIHTAAGSGAQATTTLSLAGDDWALGTYQWQVTSPGRRTATERFELEPPVIEQARADREVLRADRDGELRQPVTITATLWDQASWELEIVDPAGTVVHHDEGVGATLTSTWDGPITEPGTYAWTIRAEDARPVSGTLPVTFDLFPRVADTADPVAASAALSRLVFDAGTAEHAVLARADRFADALAGGPLAGAAGPLLLTPSDRLADEVAAELDRVLPPGGTVYVLGGEVALGEEVVAALGDTWQVERLAGETRLATAAAIAEEVVARSGTDTALIARAFPDDAAPWADALAGGAWGAAEGVPVLLTDTDALSEETARALEDLGIARTEILGGDVAVSEAVAAALPDPRRLAGDDRTGTAVAVADRLWSGRPEQVILANGYAEQAWAWALAAAPLAASHGAPLLLTTPTTLAASTAAWLEDVGTVTEGFALGGPELLSEEAVAAANLAVGGGR